MQQRSDGWEVKPRSRAYIRQLAGDVRSVFGYTEAYFPIVELLDYGWATAEPKFYMMPIEVPEMCSEFGGTVLAMTYPEHLLMKVRQDIYEKACNGDGMARFTLAHELGHLVMHRGIGMNRRSAPMTAIYANSEWQADVFASELLISIAHVEGCSTIMDFMRRFGVSASAARTMMSVMQQEGIM